MSDSGSIYYQEQYKRWRGQIYLPKEPGKPRKKKVVYGKSKREVKEKLSVINAQLLSKTYIDYNNMTIFQMGDKILENQLLINEIGQSTYDRKKETLKKLEPLHNLIIQEVTEDQIIKYFGSIINYSQSYINKIYQLLNNIFSEALRKKIIVENIMLSIKRPKSKQDLIKVRALTLDEEKKFLEIIKSHNIKYSEQMLISLFTGMRMGEINALEVKDIDFKNKYININKTVSRGIFSEASISNSAKTKAGNRKIPIDNNLETFLKDCIGDKTSGLIFSNDNRIIGTQLVNSAYSKLMKRYHIVDPTVEGKIDLHSLRHTYATRCIESGMPPKVLQKFLGHTDISITMNTYCDAFDQYVDDNAKIVLSYFKKNNLSIN